MNKRSTILILFLITFLAGGLSGYLLRQPVTERFTEKKEQNDVRRNGESSQLRERRFKVHIVRELGLTEEQQPIFFETIARQRLDLRMIWDAHRMEMNQRFREQHLRNLEELDTLLTREQLEKWDAMSRRAMNMGQPGGPGPSRRGSPDAPQP